MKLRWHVIRLCQIYRIALICILAASASLVAEPSHAQDRKPTGREVAAIRDCAKRTKDNLDDGERRCVFNLVATPCINKLPKTARDHAVVDCYDLENLIWGDLLNQNYKSLLDTLDDDQKAKARHAERMDCVSRHHLPILLRQDPRHDGEPDDCGLRCPRVGTAGDAARFLQRLVSGGPDPMAGENRQIQMNLAAAAGDNLLEPRPTQRGYL
jgi:hypothetical protein